MTAEEIIELAVFRTLSDITSPSEAQEAAVMAVAMLEARGFSIVYPKVAE